MSTIITTWKIARLFPNRPPSAKELSERFGWKPETAAYWVRQIAKAERSTLPPVRRKRF